MPRTLQTKNQWRIKIKKIIKQTLVKNWKLLKIPNTQIIPQKYLKQKNLNLIHIWMPEMKNSINGLYLTVVNIEKYSEWHFKIFPRIKNTWAAVIYYIMYK